MGSLAKKLAGEKNIIFIFISDEDPKHLLNVLKKKNIDNTENFYVVASKTQLPLDYTFVPTTFIFSRDNRNGYKYVGGFKWDTKEMIEALKNFIKENSSE